MAKAMAPKYQNDKRKFLKEAENTEKTKKKKSKKKTQISQEEEVDITRSRK